MVMIDGGWTVMIDGGWTVMIDGGFLAWHGTARQMGMCSSCCGCHAAHAMVFLVRIDAQGSFPLIGSSHLRPILSSSPHLPTPHATHQWYSTTWAALRSVSFHPPCEVDFSQYDADNWQRCWLASLPDFNQSNPTIAAALVRSTAYLVHTFAFDAIRVDAAHHMPPEFVRSLASHLRVPAFAELSIPLLPLPHRLLAGRAYTNHATAELQQALQLAMVRAFTASAEAASMVELARAMTAVFEGAGNADFQGSFLDNHDSPRLLGLLQGDQQLLRNALALLLTSRGIPLVYSGTEQAFMGGPDPQNRQSLWPFLNTHHPLYGFLAAVIRFRQKVT
ncbi:unnamed protein product [Closterium sp. NIES-65]|nr:unnamed protein product [Closterium sp. NIES-65]